MLNTRTQLDKYLGRPHGFLLYRTESGDIKLLPPSGPLHGYPPEKAEIAWPMWEEIRYRLLLGEVVEVGEGY